MSEIDMLRLLINERLTAAAEEIFSVFGRAISDLEEKLSLKSMEVERQKRLLELSMTPCVKIEPDLPLIQESSSTVYSVEVAEVPEELQVQQVKEEPEEMWSAGGRGEGATDANHVITSDKHPEEPNPPPPLTMHEQRETPNGLDCEPGTSALTRAHVMPLPSVPAVSPQALKCRTLRSGLPANPPYVCSVCGKAFSQRMYWAAHVRLHRGSLRGGDNKTFRGGDNKSFRCDICGKWLTRLDGLEKHLRVHTGEKPYGCHLCGKRFSDNSNYKRHIRRHGGGDSAMADTSTDMLGVLQDTQ